MKRILVTILMVLYMAGAMGATVHLHYCMGQLVGASLMHHEQHKCGKCGMVKKATNNGCCNDVHKSFKTAEHNKVAPSFIPGIPFHALPTNVFYCSNQVQYYHGEEKLACTLAHAPPNKGKRLPIYLQIRNLRI